MGIFWALIKTVRPRQWVKNFSLLAAAVFSGFLFMPGVLLTVVEAMVVFTLLASGVYLFNDLIDIERDRKHPFKMKRPIASGELPVSMAVLVMVFCLVSSLAWAYQLNFFFFLTALAYAMMQVLYSLYLKKVTIVDVMLVASGYVLRIYAGAVVINVHMNVWFLLTVVSASLFLAIGKRRSEMTLLKGSGQTASVRITLKHYTEQLLDVYTAMFANATWLTYALFTFNHPKIVPQGKILTLMSDLPLTLMSEKLMMITTPLVIFGVMRYLQLIYEKNEGESPERIFLSDKPLIITVLAWGVLVIGLLYKVD